MCLASFPDPDWNQVLEERCPVQIAGPAAAAAVAAAAVLLDSVRPAAPWNASAANSLADCSDPSYHPLAVEHASYQVTAAAASYCSPSIYSWDQDQTAGHRHHHHLAAEGSTVEIPRSQVVVYLTLLEEYGSCVGCAWSAGNSAS